MVSTALRNDDAALRRWRPDKVTVVGTASLLCLLAIWSAVSAIGLVDETMLPSPLTLIDTVRDLLRDGYAGSSIFEHIWASFRRVLIGFSLALLIGIPVGVICGVSKFFGAAVNPIFSILRPIPGIAFVPLMVLYFGIGEASKVALIFVTTSLYVILNTESGVQHVPDRYRRLAANVDARPIPYLTKVILPAALPQIFTGIKTATALSWALVVAAELVAAQEGLGFLVMNGATFFRVPVVYVGIVLIGLGGLLMELAARAAERRILHWKGQ